MFRVDMEYAKTIGPVLDEVFKKIYGCSEDYVLYAYIPCDTSQHTWDFEYAQQNNLLATKPRGPKLKNLEAKDWFD